MASILRNDLSFLVSHSASTRDFEASVIGNTLLGLMMMLGASSFYTANRPILAADLRFRRDSIFRFVNGQDVRTTDDADK
jgi:hypothetical protein